MPPTRNGLHRVFGWHEFLNVLATSERNEKLSAADADAILSDATELMADSCYDVPAYRILSTARISGCTAYDSQYFSIGSGLIRCRLYTFDQKLIAAV